MSAISKTTVNGWTVEIHYAQDASSPRDDDSPGCHLVMKARNWDFPNEAGVRFDDFGGWEEVAAYLRETAGALAILPVYMLDHSGIALSVRDFADPWDSGQVGLAYVDAKIWQDIKARPWTGSKADQDEARKLIAGDVDTYGKYVNGEVYGYAVKDWDGEEIAACWGYYDIDEATSEAEDIARHAEHEPKCTGALDRPSGQVKHTRSCPVHPEALRS